MVGQLATFIKGAPISIANCILANSTKRCLDLELKTRIDNSETRQILHHMNCTILISSLVRFVLAKKRSFLAGDRAADSQPYM